jgi:hypothetical protein
MALCRWLLRTGKGERCGESLGQMAGASLSNCREPRAEGFSARPSCKVPENVASLRAFHLPSQRAALISWTFYFRKYLGPKMRVNSGKPESTRRWSPDAAMRNLHRTYSAEPRGVTRNAWLDRVDLRLWRGGRQVAIWHSRSTVVSR